MRAASILRRWLSATAVALLGLVLLAALPAQAQSVSYVGVGAQVTSASAGNLTPVLPVGTASGDLAVLIVAGRPSDTSEPTAPAGWTLRSSVLQNAGANDIRVMTFYRALTGGDANPSIALPAAWVGGSAGMSAQIAVWRGVHTTTPFDTADATGSSNSANSYTPPAITTVTADARVVSVVATSDENDLALATAASFTARMSGTSYDTATGGDHAVGLADKVQAAAGAVSMPEWEQTDNDPDRWVAIAFALRPAPLVVVTISYNFEEPAWSGAAGEVQDSGALGLHGAAVGGANTANTTPAAATNPGTCRYGVFDGNDDYVQVADNAALDITSELTVTAWIYMRSTPSELHTILSKDTNYEFHINGSRQVYWWWNGPTLTTSTPINLNQWHHIAITYRSGNQYIYIDGVQRAASTLTGTLPQNNDPLFIGTDLNFPSRTFDGYIDEVRILSRYSTQAEIVAIRDETRPCASTATFTVNHNGFGIHCVGENVIVDVVDSVASTPLLNYNAEVRLDTQTGYGSWELITGSGTFSDGTAGDGIASYTWPLGQSQATFRLTYPEGPPSIDVDIYQVSDTGIRDADAEGALVFSPSGFSVTAAELLDPSSVSTFAANQTAGEDFAVHIAAYGQTSNDPVCGIIEGYEGTKSLDFWFDYVNPIAGDRLVTVRTASTTVSAGVDEGTAAALDVPFTAGKAVVTAKYKDVGRIRLLLKDDTTVNAELPLGIRGATANFVVRPFDFLLSNIANPAGTIVNPQAADAAGGVFVAAGSPFRATVVARDAEATPTPNFGHESPAESVGLVPQLVAPFGGANPAIGFTTGFGAFAGGEATGVDFTWNEVGIIDVHGAIRDGDYLGAGQVTGTSSQRVGRFVPSHFVVDLNAPLLATACNAGGFTYQGQDFGFAAAPVITARAVTVGGTTTVNYAGDFFKLTNATLGARNYTSTAGTLRTSGLPDPSGDPVIASPSGGNATLTFGGTLAFERQLLAPFAAGIRLAIDVVDADGVVAVGVGPLGNPVTFGSTSGIPFNGGDDIRYGRIRVGTAVGSEGVNLPVPMRTEHYAGTNAGFVPNGDDVCTTGVALTFSSFTENLGVGETCVSDSGAPGASGAGCAAPAPLAERFRLPPTVAAPGDFNLRLAAPGAGNQGSVVITATVPAWLRYDWNTGTAGDEDPAGQATFGIFGGESRQIYTREIY